MIVQPNTISDDHATHALAAMPRANATPTTDPYPHDVSHVRSCSGRGFSGYLDYSETRVLPAFLGIFLGIGQECCIDGNEEGPPENDSRILDGSAPDPGRDTSRLA